MPFDWQIFLRILLAFIRILQALPPEADHTEVAGLLGDAIESNGIKPPKSIYDTSVSEVRK